MNIARTVPKINLDECNVIYFLTKSLLPLLSLIINSFAGMSASSSSPLSASPLVGKLTRGHSCALCQQRKIKCDGQRPCSSCVKTGVNCLAAPVIRPRRSKLTERDILDRLKQYQDLLEKHNIKYDDKCHERGPSGERQTSELSSSEMDDGKMIVEPGSSRYLERYVHISISSLPLTLSQQFVI
jgi:hypothetical protein